MNIKAEDLNALDFNNPDDQKKIVDLFDDNINISKNATDDDNPSQAEEQAAMNYLTDLNNKLISIYDLSVKPLPFDESIKVRIEDLFVALMECAIEAAHIPGGLFKFNNEVLITSIEKISKFVKKLKVQALNKTGDSLTKLSVDYNITAPLNELHYRLKRDRSDALYLGDSYDPAKDYYIGFVSDLIDRVQLFRDNLTPVTKLGSESNGIVDSQLHPHPKRRPLINSSAIIKALYDAFNDILWVNMEYVDFYNCFDINNKPLIFPEFKNRQKFAYILSEKVNDNNGIKINEKIAISQFGLNSWGILKGRAKYEKDTLFKQEVSAIFKHS